MRFLLARTDALGDLIVSFPVQARILQRDPGAEVHWLVRPYAAPLLEQIPGVSGVHLRQPDTDLVGLFRHLRPDAVLNLCHRDPAVVVAAKEAGIPIRVARTRGLGQVLAATHRLWRGRRGSDRHEAENLLDFLGPWGWAGGWAEPPHLVLTEEERNQGHADLAGIPAPRLGIATRSSGSSAFPSTAWWDRAWPILAAAGWNPVVLSPPEDSALPESGLRHLLGRLAACQAFLGPSTGPLQMATALGLPTLALMGHTLNRGPSRWSPLGSRVQVLQYPGPEADLSHGMDRLDPSALIPHLDRLR